MKKVKPVDCEEALLHIFEFIDHELHGAKRHAMQHHIDTCKSCFSRVEFERRLKEKLKALREAQTAAAARRRIQKVLKAL